LKRIQRLKHNTSIGTNGVLKIQTTEEGKGAGAGSTIR
jgi:hypothetical protein